MQDFGARLLRGDVFGGVDAARAALSKRAGATFGDADAAREQRETALAAVLAGPFFDSGLGGSRHACAQL